MANLEAGAKKCPLTSTVTLIDISGNNFPNTSRETSKPKAREGERICKDLLARVANDAQRSAN